MEKLHNINIRPLPGINVIYGENETGKSTLQQFISAMLFGVEKQPLEMRKIVGMGVAIAGIVIFKWT